MCHDACFAERVHWEKGGSVRATATGTAWDDAGGSGATLRSARHLRAPRVCAACDFGRHLFLANVSTRVVDSVSSLRNRRGQSNDLETWARKDLNICLHRLPAESAERNSPRSRAEAESALDERADRQRPSGDGRASERIYSAENLQAAARFRPTPPVGRGVSCVSHSASRL